MEPGPAPQRRGGVIAAWLGLVLAVGALALPGLDDLGMYYDEAFMAQQARDFVGPPSGGVHPASVRSVIIAGRPFPLRNAAYLGSLKSQLLIPALAIAGSSPRVVRAATLATGLLAALLAMLWADRVFGRTTALLAGLLVTTDPSFFFLSQFEWGPFTTNLLCRSGGLLLLTAAAQTDRRARSIGAAAGGGALLGLGVFSRADFALVVLALTLALLAYQPSRLRQILRERRAAAMAAAAAMMIAASPMILSSLALFSTSSEIAERGGFSYKAKVLWTVLDGSHFYRLMETGGRFDEIFAVDAPGTLFGWFLVASFLGLCAHAFVQRRARGESRNSAQLYLLTASVILVVGMLLMPGAVRAHHQLNSLPFLQLVVAAAATAAWRAGAAGLPMRWAMRGSAVLMIGVITAGNLLVITKTQTRISETGGRGRWTRALHDFAEQVDSEPGQVVVSLDWGFHEQLLFLTRETKLVEAIWAIPQQLQRGRPWTFEGGPETVYLVHSAPYDLFGAGELFLDGMRDLGFGAARIDTHVDGEGNPAFMSVRIPRPHRLVYDGKFRVD